MAESFPVRFSVVMPTYRRLATLERVLSAYEEQQPTELDFEIVVIDDGSDDGTAERLADWRSDRFRLRFDRQPNQGPAAARNRALSLAEGTWVLFTGDDIEPTPDLLARHHRAHQTLADPRVAVLGHTAWHPDEPTTATMRHIDGVGSQQFSYYFMEDGAEYDFRHLYTSNVSLRLDFLRQEPGPFSTAFPAAAFEDAELGFRLAERGMRIVYFRSAVAYHHHHYTVRSFYRRQQRCGEMAAVLESLHPEVQHLLGLDTLQDLQLDLALAGPGRVGLSSRSADDLLEQALDLAERHDPLPFSEIDGVLAALFRIGYLDGLARARFPTAADRLRARLVEDLLTPATEDFAARSRERGLPFSPAVPSNSI